MPRQARHIQTDRVDNPATSRDCRPEVKQLSSPQELQRRADQWFRVLQREARASGLAPFRWGELQLDVLDALRAPLELNNALELAQGEARPVSLRSRLRLVSYRTKTFLERRYAMPRTLPDPHRAILALPRQAGHVHDLLPVVRALERDHGMDTLFLPIDRQLLGELTGAGFPAVGLHTQGGLSLVDRAACAKFSFDLGRVLRAHDAAPFTRAEQERLAASSLAVVRADQPRVLEIARALRSLVASIRPRLLLVGNPYTLEGRTAAITARQLGVPSAALEHGTIFPESPRWSECPVDLVAVWGEPSRRALESCGVPPDRIAVTGAPRYDAVFSSFREERRPEVILVASSGAGDQVSLQDHLHFIRLVFEAAELAPETRWVIKLHPKDKEEYYLRGGRLGTDRVAVVRGEKAKTGVEIFEFLKRASVLVTVASSSALDAMAVRVPVVSVSVGATAQLFERVEFLSRGCTTRVETTAELVSAVRRPLKGIRDPETETAAERYAAEHFAHRGEAATAAARRIAELVS